MTETVVYVTNLTQWKSVLDIWFKQGYTWKNGDEDYNVNMFGNWGRFLFLGDSITYSGTNSDSKPFIEYSAFMTQQKEEYMKYDIRVSGKTIKTFSDLDAANVWRDGYQSMNPDKTVIIVKDYGRAGEK